MGRRTLLREEVEAKASIESRNPRFVAEAHLGGLFGEAEIPETDAMDETLTPDRYCSGCLERECAGTFLGGVSIRDAPCGDDPRTYGPAAAPFWRRATRSSPYICSSS